MECDWWKRRLPSEKGLLISCVLLLLTCSALIVINTITKNKLNIAEDAVNSVCHSKECISAASRILEKMDDTADPCQDFYQFACGNYIERNIVEEDNVWKSTLATMSDDVRVRIKKILESHHSKSDSITLTKAKKLYSSCMNPSSNEDGAIETLMKLLTDDGIGEWPILKPIWNNKNHTDMAWRLGKLYIHGIRPFFFLLVNSEDTFPSNYVLSIRPSLGPFLEEEYYQNSSNLKHTQYIQSYRNLIYETLRLLGVEESRSKEDIEDMMEFEVEFVKIYRQRYEPVDETEDLEDENLNPEINVFMLEKEMPEVKWGVFFDTVFDGIGLRYKSSDLKVVVDSPMYLQKLAKLLKRTSSRTVANYLTWRFVAKYMPYLDSHFQRLYDYFAKKVPLPSIEKESTFLARWRKCSHLVNKRFEFELASEYLNENYNQEIEKEVSFYITSIKEMFLKSIRKQSWLDDETKVSCEKTIATLGEEIGHPKNEMDPNKLDAYKTLLDITEDSFLDNILKMDRYDEFKELTTSGVPERMKYTPPLLLANAFYIPPSHTIRFSACLLKIPMFTPHLFRYLNFASLGSIIGHEITHGFANRWEYDDYSVTDESTREPPPLCFESVLEKFNEKEECFVEQYSQFPLDKSGHNVNGTTTLKENMCDNSAIAQAYAAYKHYVSEHGEEPRLSGMKYSNDQVFFLQYAQIWCEISSKEGKKRFLSANIPPGKYRATVPLMNFPEFSSVFNCPAGSPMNPVKKCRLLS